MKRGRPATQRGAYNPLPVRQLGRVDDATWEILRNAAKRQEIPFSSWAIEVLIREAKRKRGNGKKKINT